MPEPEWIPTENIRLRVPQSFLLPSSVPPLHETFRPWSHKPTVCRRFPFRPHSEYVWENTCRTMSAAFPTAFWCFRPSVPYALIFFPSVCKFSACPKDIFCSSQKRRHSIRQTSRKAENTLKPRLRKIFSPVFDVCNAGDTFAEKYLKRHAEQTCGCNGTLG